MKTSGKNNSIRFVFFVMALVLLLSRSSFAQTKDSTRYFGGLVSVTNNGISLLPTFSLNKPAALLVMNVGRRLSFDPEFRFSLNDGKPWAFIFWTRYKLVDRERFRFSVGAHPGYLFKSQSFPANGGTNDIITTERYLAAEVAPNYFVRPNISIGVYYLTSFGFKESSVKKTNFLTLNVNFTRIQLYKSYYLKFHPQFYYLKMDDKDGYYFTSTVTAARDRFPLSLQTVMNKTIQSGIASKNLIWNVSLIYSFGNRYKRVDA